MTIEIITGDITEQDVDAIVMSANPSMLAGGGVSGAIHKAAGPDLEKECLIIGHVDAGNAALTGGYNLKARHIIHVVSIQWHDGHYHDEVKILEKCYHSIFGIVEMEGFKSVSIPAIGTGRDQWPLELATPIAVKKAKEFEDLHPDVLIRFVCFSDDVAAAYRAFMAK